MRVLLVTLALTVFFSPFLFSQADSAEKTIDDAQTHLGRGEYQKALELLDRVPGNAPPAIILQKHRVAAQVLTQLRKYPQAREHLERAQELATKLNNADELTRIEIVRTGVLIGTGQRAASLAAAKAAVALGRKADPRILGMAYRNLSRSYFEMEDWEQTIVAFQKALEAMGNPSVNDLTAYSQTAAGAYFQMNDRDAAETEYKKAIEFAIQRGNKNSEASSRCNLGRMYWEIDRDREKALQMLDGALELVTDTNTPVCLINRANVFRDTGEFEKAIAGYQKAIDLEKQVGTRRDTPLALRNLAQLYRMMGRYRDALSILSALVADLADVPPRIQWMTRLELASVYEATGDPQKAQAEYRQTLEILEEIRRSALLDSSRTGSFAYNLDRFDPYERYIRFLLSQPHDVDRIRESFEVSERARARAFLDMLASVRTSAAETVPLAVLEQENDIFQTISRLQAQLRNTQLSAAEREQTLREVTRSEEDLNNWRLRLRRDYPNLAAARYPDLAGLEVLQESLRPEESVVSYFLGKANSYRWVIRRDAIRADILPPRSEIDTAIARFRMLLASPSDKAALDREAASLSELLIGSIDLPPHTPLVVVTHGSLSYIPFEALRSRGKMLIEEHPITYAPSLNSLKILRQAERRGGPFRILAVGDPLVQADVPSATTRSGGIDIVDLLGPLPYSREEVNRIQSHFLWQSRVLAGREADEQRLLNDDLSSYRILHFATHGLVNESRPNRSGLLLSAASSYDGVLQVAEIYRLRLNSDLVVLSACQTALGKEVTGEGIVGLTRAFFYAGTRSVLSSLWNINDRFAGDFMDAFYDGIQAGKTSEDALREAKLKFIHDPNFAHPFYWSPFVITGDATRVLYEQDERTLLTLTMWFFGSLIPVVAAVLITGFFTSRKSGPDANKNVE